MGIWNEIGQKANGGEMYFVVDNGRTHLRVFVVEAGRTTPL